MAQGPDGRFVKGGGEDFVPQLPMETYMNLRHVDCLLGGAGAGVAVPVETGLNLESQGDVAPRGLKWVLFGGMYQPKNDAALTGFLVAGAASLLIQVQRGQRAIGDLADRSKQEVIAQGCFSDTVSAEQHNNFPLPLDLVHPTPVVSKYITVIAKNSNHAKLNSLSWTVTLFFGFAALTERDRTALLQQAIS